MKNHSRTDTSMMFKVLFLAVLLQGTSYALQSNNVIPTSGGWRVALNLGREPLTTMPKSWASTGARFPLVIKCNFTDDGVVQSITGDVRFTGLDGEVITPVDSGSWSYNDNTNDFSFTLSFPEKVERTGITIGGPDCNTIECTGLLFSEERLKELDKELYAARSSADNADAQVKEIKRRAEAPKKWNFKTEKWERRYKKEPLLSNIGKKVQLLLAEQSEKKERTKRPMPAQLSIESGEFPGISSNVYFGKTGTIKLKGRLGNSIIGTWGAEPINDNPASYFRPSY